MRIAVILAVAACSIFGRFGAAAAEQQLIIGKRLLITNPRSGPQNNKLVYLSKDTGFEFPAGASEDPRCAPEGSGLGGMVIVTGSGFFSIHLPCENWSLNAAGTMYRYEDSSGGTCRIVIIKAGTLQKVVCKGPQVSYEVFGPTPEVILSLELGAAAGYHRERTWCAEFDPTLGCTVVRDGSNERSWLAKNCSAPATRCSPSGAFVDPNDPF